MSEDVDSFPLHKAVFDNDLKTLSRLLRKHDVAAKDRHGKKPISFYKERKFRSEHFEVIFMELFLVFR